MKLPTLKRIKRAYKNTGVKFCKGTWYQKGAACPFGAITLDKGIVSTKMNLERRASKAHDYAEQFEDWQDFVRGIDGSIDNSDTWGCYNLDAYNYGVKVREVLEKEFS